MDASEGHGRAGSRRAFLGRVGAATVAGLAGCLAPDESDVPIDEEGERLVERGLDEAGVDPPVETTIYANAENDERIRWAQLVQYVLNETDLFDVGFEQLEWGQYEQLCLNMAETGENALISLDVSGGWDPHSYVDLLFHSDNRAPDGLNFNHFTDETVDDLIETGLAESDPQRRREVYASLEEALADRAPVSFVRFGESVTVYRRGAVDDWRQYPLPGNEYDPVYAPYAGTYASPVDDAELVGDAPAAVSNPDPIRMHDTTSNMATSLLYEGLVAIDFDGTPRPQLATEWERLDETTYRFVLREGATFHNGESLTPEHVRFSFERYEGAPRENDVYEWYDGVDVVGDAELEIHLSRPYGPFETSVGLPIVPLAAGDDGDVDLSSAPVGTGPYQFADRTPSQWTLDRFDDHWFEGTEDVPERPPVETIRMRIIPESASRQAALETGEIDVSTDVPAAGVEAFEADDDYGVERAVAGQYDFLVYPSYLTPFDEADVRRGIDRLLPRERIVGDVYAGHGTVANTPFPPLIDGVDAEKSEGYFAADYDG